MMLGRLAERWVVSILIMTPPLVALLESPRVGSKGFQGQPPCEPRVVDRAGNNVLYLFNDGEEAPIIDLENISHTYVP
jgi:hypothetical protein